MDAKRVRTLRRRCARVVAFLLPLCAWLSAPSVARAEWPDHTITIIVHFAPGGSNDLLGRVIAAELAPALGQSVIVENRPGANGNVGLASAARARPDGYTLVVASGVVVVNPSLGKTSYDPLRDFAPVAYLGTSPTVFLTRPGSGIASIADLIAQARANPGKLNFSSPGVGSISELAVDLLELRTGTKMTHLPYSGAAPAAQAAIAGTVDFASVNVSGMMGLVQSGTLAALVQTGAERWPELPKIPTLDEAGIHDAENDTAQMLLAPAGTPQPIIDRLATEILKILQRPDVREKMFKAGFAVNGKGPDELRAWMTSEVPRWKAVIDQAGIKAN